MKNNLVVQQHFGNLRSTKILERKTFFDNYLTSEVKKRKNIFKAFILGLKLLNQTCGFKRLGES